MGDKTAISEQAIRGMTTFETAGCASCHSGAGFAGPTMPPGTGVFMKFPTFPARGGLDKYRLLDDQGRYEVTGDEADRHTWRVPTLRNLVYTAP